MIPNLEHKLEYYKFLNEVQRRQYLGLLAQDIGRGGVREISDAFGKLLRQIFIADEAADGINFKNESSDGILE